jgi:hypothetical protein
MGELISRLRRVVVEATSPDGSIRARVRDRLEFDLEFGRRVYGSYPDAELARQLGMLATLTWTKYRRACLDVENAFLDWSMQEQDTHDRLFEERAERVTVAAQSPGEWVTVQSRALVRWDFTLVPGVQRRLTEQRFVAEVLGAAGATVRAYRAERARLLDQFYDLAGGLPPWRRERAVRLGARSYGEERR